MSSWSPLTAVIDMGTFWIFSAPDRLAVTMTSSTLGAWDDGVVAAVNQQHGDIDRARYVVFGEFERRTDVDDLVEPGQLVQRYKQVFQFGDA